MATHLRITLTLLVTSLSAVAGLAAQSVRQSAYSTDGMVASGQPLATDAGARMLEMGGNAADAATAAAFAIAVVEPTMNSIGGRNQILVRLPSGEFFGIDGATQAPWNYDPDAAPPAQYGYDVIGIPGAVAGLLKLHSRFGSLPLATVLAPAIDYAERGFRVLPLEAMREAYAAPQAAEFEGTRRYYLKDDGSSYRAGELLVQTDLGRTLRAITKGGEATFYRGEIARLMAADLGAHGSAVSLEALASYEALDATVVRGSYRGYEIVGLAVPAAGTVAIQALQIIERFHPGDYEPVDWAAIVGQAIGYASKELDVLRSDTAQTRALSKEWAAHVASERIAVPSGSPPGRDTAGDRPIRQDGTGHTTHLTAADSSGMWVGLTQSLGPNMGSKVATPGLGFLYASTLGGYLGRMQGGERARTYMSPLMVLKDGKPVMMIGAAGGGRIIGAIVNAVTRVLDDGMSLPAALGAPRGHMNFYNDVLDLETSPDIGWTPEEVATLDRFGIPLTQTSATGAFGRAHGVQYDAATRTYIGAADPDWEGSARGPMRLPGR